MTQRNRQGFSLLEIMLVLAIMIMLASLLAGYVLPSKIGVNDMVAQKTLRTMSDAAEAYANDNAGVYPTNMDILILSAPPYLEENSCNTMYHGFAYNCTIGPGGYQFTATPVEPGKTGSRSYRIVTGGHLAESPGPPPPPPPLT